MKSSQLATQHTLVSRVLDQCVLENKSARPRRLASGQQSRFAQRVDATLEHGLFTVENPLEQIGGKLAPDCGGTLRDVARCRRAIQARHQRILQSRGYRDRIIMARMPVARLLQKGARHLFDK